MKHIAALVALILSVSPLFAVAEEEQKLIVEALRTLKRQSDAGNTTARGALEHLRDSGITDYTKAHGGQAGRAEAAWRIGGFYSVPPHRDTAAAARWLRMAAMQSHAEAQFLLGVMYANGKGVPEDHVEAVRWHRLAAEQRTSLPARAATDDFPSVAGIASTPQPAGQRECRHHAAGEPGWTSPRSRSEFGVQNRHCCSSKRDLSRIRYPDACVAIVGLIVGDRQIFKERLEAWSDVVPAIRPTQRKRRKSSAQSAMEVHRSVTSEPHVELSPDLAGPNEL